MIRPRNKHEGVRWLAILANSTIRDSITRHDKAKRVEAIGNSADCVRAKYEAQYYSDPPPRSTAFANCRERHTLLIDIAVGNAQLDQRQQALGRANDAQEISAAPVLAPKLQYQKIASVLRLEGTYTTKLTRIATVI